MFQVSLLIVLRPASESDTSSSDHDEAAGDDSLSDALGIITHIGALRFDHRSAVHSIIAAGSDAMGTINRTGDNIVHANKCRVTLCQIVWSFSLSLSLSLSLYIPHRSVHYALYWVHAILYSLNFCLLVSPSVAPSPRAVCCAHVFAFPVDWAVVIMNLYHVGCSDHCS